MAKAVGQNQRNGTIKKKESHVKIKMEKREDTIPTIT